VSVIMIKKKRRKEEFVTLSPTRIEVTGFNNLDSWILNNEGHALDSGCRCIEDTQSNNDIGQYSLDNEEAVE
jgi:hypothetical protein